MRLLWYYATYFDSQISLLDPVSFQSKADTCPCSGHQALNDLKGASGNCDSCILKRKAYEITDPLLAFQLQFAEELQHLQQVEAPAYPSWSRTTAAQRSSEPIEQSLLQSMGNLNPFDFTAVGTDQEHHDDETCSLNPTLVPYSEMGDILGFNPEFPSIWDPLPDTFVLEYDGWSNYTVVDEQMRDQVLSMDWEYQDSNNVDVLNRVD
jgi:hypothetical protein